MNRHLHHAATTVIVLSLASTACESAADRGWETDTTAAAVDASVVEALRDGGIAQTVIEFDATADRDAALAAIGADVQRAYKRLPLAAVTLRSLSDLDDVVAAGGVVRVHDDVVLHATGMTEGLSLIGQPDAAAAGFEGEGRSVVVVDTGVDWSLPEFGSCARVGTGCRVVAAEDIAPDDGVADDASRHGTNVAGIVAAVAPGADIIALDVFDGSRASSRDVLAAIDWAIDNRDRYGIAALNLSLGTADRVSGACDDSVFAPAIGAALQANIVTVTSSGNHGDAEAISAPGCVTDALTVGAVNATPITAAYEVCKDIDAGADSVACFSNASPMVDLLAPGSRVDAGGVIMSGTSQASPHVAGAVAVLAAESPDAETWIAKLVSSAAPVRDTRNNRIFARLDLEAATYVAPPPATEPPVAEPPVAEPPVKEPPAPRVPAVKPPAPKQPNFKAPNVRKPGEPFVLIDGGAETTSSRTVTLTLGSPKPSVMCISNTTSCDNWVEFQSEVSWTLADAEGSQAVYVYFPAPSQGKFRNVRVSDDIIVE